MPTRVRGDKVRRRREPARLSAVQVQGATRASSGRGGRPRLVRRGERRHAARRPLSQSGSAPDRLERHLTACRRLLGHGEDHRHRPTCAVARWIGTSRSGLWSVRHPASSRVRRRPRVGHRHAKRATRSAQARSVPGRRRGCRETPEPMSIACLDRDRPSSAGSFAARGRSPHPRR